MAAPPAHLVLGEDPILRGDTLRTLIHDLLGDDDPSLALEDFTLSDEGSADPVDAGAVLASALIAAETPPFGTERRVIVLRDIGALSAANAAGLVRYLENPMPSTVLVLVAGGGRMAPALTKAFKAAGGAELKTAEATSDALSNALKQAGVKLTAGASRLVVDRLGEDAGRVSGFVDLLASSFGEGRSLDVDDIEPFLGEPGSVPPYHLTAAIDDGDLSRALDVLARLRGSGFHPLQVMVMLHRHYQRMLRLDDPGIVDEAGAVAALGGKVKPYPAKLALRAARALGTDGIRTAYDALARADVDLRGATAAPEDAVLQVLVARLAGLSRRAGVASSGGRRR